MRRSWSTPVDHVHRRRESISAKCTNKIRVKPGRRFSKGHISCALL
jgi:hypothetical protein